MNNELPDFSGFYALWHKLPSGPRAEIRRVSEPDELLDLPAFYRLVEPFGWRSDIKPWERESWKRLVFLVNYVKDKGEHSLGKALALSKVSEKRLFQIIRADSPGDVNQLRRLLKQAEPEVNWRKVAKQFWFWNKKAKRSLLEEFVLNQKN